MKLYEGYERLDLTEGMRNKDKPNGDSTYGWSAGEQIDAMRFYCPEKFEILKTEEFGSYQGDIIGIAVWDKLGDNRRYVLWIDSFGTCSFCDGLEDRNGYDYIEDILRSNTWQFLSLKDLKDYLVTDFKSLHMGCFSEHQDEQSMKKLLDWLGREGHMSAEYRMNLMLNIGVTIEKFNRIRYDLKDLNEWLEKMQVNTNTFSYQSDRFTYMLESEGKNIIDKMSEDLEEEE